MAINPDFSHIDIQCRHLTPSISYGLDYSANVYNLETGSLINKIYTRGHDENGNATMWYVEIDGHRVFDTKINSTINRSLQTDGN
jgi:hypothetical protein